MQAWLRLCSDQEPEHKPIVNPCYACALKSQHLNLTHMNYYYLAGGILLFLFTSFDIVKTTLSFNGAGSVTNHLARGIWKLFFYLSGKNGRSNMLPYAGSVILVTVLLTWILMLWGGLLLMLMAETDSVQNSSTKAWATVTEKLYYAGFTLSTLGVGDFNATSDLFRIITSVTAFAGLAFITASITYFIPVLQAVGLQSKLSFYIISMGSTPYQILHNSWNGKDFSSFFGNVTTICQMLMQHIAHHHSYPIIHYFHNNRPQFAISPAVVLLTETYNLLQYAVKPEATDKLKLTMLKHTLDQYLQMVHREFIKDAKPDEQAPMPALKPLQNEGIPLQSEEKIKEIYNQRLKEQRNVLTLLLEEDGWTWQQVYGEEAEL